MQETIQTMKITSLYALPAGVTSPTKKIVDHYVEIASTRPNDLPLIEVGRVNEKHYVITHDDIWKACKQVNLSEIRVNVSKYDSLTDALVQHVRKNKDPSSFDPLLVRDAVDYLAEQGIDENKAMRMFLLNNTATEKIIRLPLSEQAIKKLRGLHETLSEKLSSVSIPPYILVKIAKIEPAKQNAAIDEVITIVMMETLSDAKFAWPNTDVIDDSLNEFMIKTKKEEMPKIVTFTEDPGKLSEAENTETPILEPSKKTVKEVTNIAKTFSNIVFIPGDETRRSMIVNTKTGRASEIKNNAKFVSLEGDFGSKAYVFPDKATKYLDLDNDGKIFMKKFENSGELQTILNKVNKKKTQISGVIFTKEKL